MQQKILILDFGFQYTQLIARRPLFDGLNEAQVWMSHSDTIAQAPAGFHPLVGTESIGVVAYRSDHQRLEQPIYCLQFHPEVTHSLSGKTLIKNFVINIAGCTNSWTPESFVETTVQKLRQKIGSEKVLLGLSGGVDSSLAAILLHQAIGEQLFCFFIDNGLLRKNEYKQVLESYRRLGLNIKEIDAKAAFFNELKDISDPEKKRKAIGRIFIEVFENEANKLDDIQWLAQDTTYPDVIESVSVHSPSVTIKSHHNVGGLPEKLNLKIVEPLRMLFNLSKQLSRSGTSPALNDGEAQAAEPDKDFLHKMKICLKELSARQIYLKIIQRKPYLSNE